MSDKFCTVYLMTSEFGKKYFGQTIGDILEYNGSGTEWKEHLKLPENGIKNKEILFCSDNWDLVREFCTRYSIKNDIVENSDYLNLVMEYGPRRGQKENDEVPLPPLVYVPKDKFEWAKEELPKWEEMLERFNETNYIPDEWIAREVDCYVSDVKALRPYSKDNFIEGDYDFNSMESGSFEEINNKIDSDFYTQIFEDLFETLTKREADVLKRFYGFNDENGNPYVGESPDETPTLTEIGEEFDLTRERVRQIKNKALQRMRNSTRRNILRNFEEVTEDFVFPQFS